MKVLGPFWSFLLLNRAYYRFVDETGIFVHDYINTTIADALVPCVANTSVLSSIGKVFNYLNHLNVERLYKIWIYCVTWNNLAQQGLFPIYAKLNNIAKLDMAWPPTPWIIMTWKPFTHLRALYERNPSVIRGFPSQRASNVKLWCFLYYQPEQAVEQTAESPVIGKPMHIYCLEFSGKGLYPKSISTS